MGNGQSDSSSSGINSRSSASFLSNKKTNSMAKGKVIVVKQGTNTGLPSSSRNDDLMRRFSEIPKFYPILKGAVNQSGLRDPLETTFKISARPFLKLSHRLQEHLSHCANVALAEQGSLANAIKDVDHTIAMLLLQYAEQKKSLDRFQNNVIKIGDLQAHISNLRFLFQDIIPMAETLNEILPEQRRLPLLNISHLMGEANGGSDERHFKSVQETPRETCSGGSNFSDFHIEPIAELAVIDESIA